MQARQRPPILLRTSFPGLMIQHDHHHAGPLQGHLRDCYASAETAVASAETAMQALTDPHWAVLVLSDIWVTALELRRNDTDFVVGLTELA